MIEVRDASFGYGGRPVVSGVSCRIERGSFSGLVGPNGSGKTTFLRGLLGKGTLLSGTVTVAEGARFAYVPQADSMNLFWPLTLRQTALLGLRSRRPFGRMTQEELLSADLALERTGLSGLGELSLREASGGQRQRAVLAQAIALSPDVLLLDEPTRGLDIQAESALIKLIEELRRERGLTVIMVTHSLSIPLNHAEKILLFGDGKASWKTPAEVRTLYDLA